MNAENWQEHNTRYLSIALEWLRMRLLKLAKPATTLASSLTLEASSPSLMERFLRRTPGTPTPALPALPPPANPEEQIAQLEKEMKSFEDTNPPPAFIALKQLLVLSPFEGNVLLLCAALELDTRIAGLVCGAQDHPGNGRSRPLRWR
jgi:hypothetical protein